MRGGTSEFNISKDTTFWIATKTGDTYYCDGFGKPWNYGKFHSDESAPLSGMTFERASFFNHDTGYISGFIQKKGKQDFIFWTKDGGQNWEEINFGESSWIDANFIDYNGHAWMSGSSQLIYYSHDFGRTWTAFDKIEPTTNMRISSIYFSDTTKGIVGDFWNRIYITNDNCKTWQKITSPLDQKRYKNYQKGARPEIRKAERFGKYLIVNQQGHIFYTGEDTIEWKELNNIVDFEYDKDNNRVYVITNELRVGILDGAFHRNWTSTEKLISSPICLRVFNGSLYVWNRYQLYRLNPHKFEVTPVYTNDQPIEKPEVTAKATYKIWGASGREVFQSDDFGKTWYRLTILPFYMGNFKPITDEEAIVSDGALSKFYLLSVTDEAVKFSPYQVVNPLDHFLEKSVKEFYVEKGSRGCFHFRKERIGYEIDHDTIFTCRNIEKTEGDDISKKKYKSSITLRELHGLLGSINTRPGSLQQLKQMMFSASTRNDYQEEIERVSKIKCQNDSPEFKIGSRSYTLPYFKVDFTFYKTQYDSIELLSDSLIRTILSQQDGGWSTTTNWLKISMTNESGNELVISNTDLVPNAWYLPWIVTVDGLSFPVTSTDITRFLERLAPEGFIMSETEMNVQAVFQVIDYIYREKLKE